VVAVETERRYMIDARQYELMYVVAPTVGEDGVAELQTQIEEIVADGDGHVDKTDNWGRRRLAYEINHHNDGTYMLVLMTGPGELIPELDRRLKVIDDVLRHLVVRVDEDLRKADRAREKRRAWHQRRRAARGLPPEEIKPPVAIDAPPTAEVVETPAAETADAPVERPELQPAAEVKE
jgi:small subunit ribosomal protein S6